MAAFVETARTGDPRDGEIKMVEVAGDELVLARVDDGFYALDSRCPRMGGEPVSQRIQDDDPDLPTPSQLV